MVDTFEGHGVLVLENNSGLRWAQIQLLDDVRQEQYFDAAVGGAGAQADGLTREGVTHFPRLVAITQPATAIDFAGFYANGIFERGQDFWVGAWTGPVTLHWRFQAQGFMRALGIVNGPPAIKGSLDLGLIAPATAGQHFGLERSMKAFFLALGLRMICPAMTGADAQAHQPHVQGSVFVSAAAPRRAVIPEYAGGQAIAAKGANHMPLHGGLPLIRARHQQDVVAGVVVQCAQWMAATLVQSKMTFEIHLPQLIGDRPFKALIRL